MSLPPSRHGRRRRAHCSAASALTLALPLATLVAIRGDTRDTSVYIEVFQGTRAFPLDPIEYYRDTLIEWAFGIVSWLFNAIGLGPTALFFLISLLTFIFIDRTARQVGLRLIDVLPYYLGSFYLLQQFMTIRQGLGVAFATSVVVANVVHGSRAWRVLGGTFVATTLHLVSIIPILVGRVLQEALPAPRRARVVLWVMLVVVLSAMSARLVISLDVFAAMDRLALYASDAELGSERSLFEPANIRAALILGAVLSSPAALLRSRAYLLLAGMYAAHLGLRLGFYDFAILSGRLASSLGFVEIFILPWLIRVAVRTDWLRWLLGLSYLALHAFATLTLQAPYLIDDYFTPLHPNYTFR